MCEVLIAGVDEVGRGPLAGPVVAAAVVLDPQTPIAGLKDSKLLSPLRRETLAAAIRERARYWSLGRADVAEIDALNILQASLLAMQRAVEGLPVVPQRVLVDGRHLPRLSCPAEAIVKGDARVAEISAAAIIAKVARDTEMQRLHERYPGYGFDRHKGYPTKEHREQLVALGVTPQHRRSFAPVARILDIERE